MLSSLLGSRKQCSPWHPPWSVSLPPSSHHHEHQLDCINNLRFYHRVHHSGRGRYHTAGRLETRRARVTEPDLSSRFGCGLRCASGRRLRAIPASLAARESARHAWSRGCLGAVWRVHHARRFRLHARRQDFIFLSIWHFYVLHHRAIYSVLAVLLHRVVGPRRSRGKQGLHQTFGSVCEGRDP